MEQSGRHKTKYISPHTSTWSANQTTNAKVPSDAYWKYTQRSHQDTIDKNTRRHQSPMPESTVSYYSSANSYKTLKHNAYPSTHPKHSSAFHTEVPQRYQQITTKSARNKDRTNNVAVINKDRYKTQQEDENTEYIDDELGNFTEDNLGEDAEEEAENDRSLRGDKRVGEIINKEYDEHEADDEIDEESDAPAETQAIQRNLAQRDALRAQRMRMINQQQDPHIIRYSQQAPKLYQAYHLPTRYYHNTPDHDIHETLSEEDLYTAQALKNPPRRSSMGYHQNWIPQRSSTDRYDTMTSLTQPSRRARTRPEMKSFTEAEFADRRKCSRCGNISTRKPSTSRRNNCRFQDSPNFSTKARFGDDVEILDQSWCGHCKPKHHFEGNMGSCEIPSSALYSMKSRRSRDTSIPMHETLKEKHPVDEISHEFARMSSRYTKDTPNTLRDRARHSAQTAQGATRISVRYDP
ncbi:PREDICTED: uncharacterized protein LOC105449941 isoform X2 [Wasmannia auropunctata]|nr:PREDICTED: uncharacterized protein LOC105449941 isoform X2 [Wasmannia auropunctata]XP_011687715.1 PREDICTED: uncharacterized protein LOC105449941 isoform X2 [Wasmannia auropunctata]